jgi:D-tyrosyl-tRNA(Tyr) deacylase
MRAVVQRVTHAKVDIDEKTVGKIDRGLLVLLAVADWDEQKDIDYLAEKIINLRIFEDQDGKMNCSIDDVGGQLLVVSQFTLYGDCRKGRRPSFHKAADPQKAEDFYLRFVKHLQDQGLEVQTGEFRAMMDVELTNQGPVTFILESPNNANH